MIFSHFFVLPLASLPPAGDAAIWKVAIVTVLVAVEFAVVWWGRKALLSRINRIAVARTKRITSLRLRLLGLQQIMQLARMGVRLVSIALMLAGALVWLASLPALFPETQSLAGRLETAIVDELQVVATSILTALPGLGVILVILFVTRIAHEFLNHYFRSIEDGEVTSEVFDEVTAETTRRLLGVGLWLCAVIIAYPYIPGSDSPVFKGVSILAGLMVSLGANNLVGQILNGLILIYTRTIRPGDAVVIGETEGTIEQVGLFSCTVRTPNEELVTLPNSTVAAGLRNFSQARSGSAVRFAATVTIGYDARWQQVHELLLAAASATPEIRREPAPEVRQVALDDFYVRYELLFAPADPSRRRLVLSRLHEAIQDRFHAAGVQIMSPHYETDPATAKIPQPPEPAVARREPKSGE